MKMYRIFGSNMAQPQPELCGSVIVENDSDKVEGNSDFGTDTMLE